MTTVTGTVVVRQVGALRHSGDLLIILSISDTSENVVRVAHIGRLNYSDCLDYRKAVSIVTKEE